MSKIKVITKTKTIEFAYKNKPYRYEYTAAANYGFSYIYLGKTKIFGPMQTDCTEEGKEVYNAFKEANIKF